MILFEFLMESGISFICQTAIPEFSEQHMNILTLIYFKLVELMSTIDPSASGIMNALGMRFMDLSNTTDPVFIISFILETLLLLVAIFIIFPITLAYRLFMGLIGQPVPVPWF